MANHKTVQAMKVSASWTPNEETAALMFFGTTDLLMLNLTFTSGRLSLKTAIRANYSDPEYTVLVSKRIKAIEAGLRACGEVHSFVVTAGAVLPHEAHFAPDEHEEPEVQPEGETPQTVTPDAIDKLLEQAKGRKPRRED